MNQTHLEHAAVGVAMLLIMFALFRDQWIGAAFGIAFYLGREVREFERIAARAGDVSFFAGAKMWKWSFDAWMDLLSPAAACLAAAYVISRIVEAGRRKREWRKD